MSINKNDFKCCGPFKLWTIENFPFIEADFDAITNYQLYSKIVEYVRKIAENQNALNNSYNELIEAFNNLEDYINNYFENLDVQEEINNKLDDMAESGELTEIIAQYLGLAGIITYNNVSEMKLAENLVNGSKCCTLGYYNVNDGGKALYKIRNITNEDTVDEKFLIALNDVSLIAELIVDDYFTIDSIGAKGDGTTDDSSYFESALSKIKVINGNPSKTYKADINITNSNTTLNEINLKGTITFDEGLRFITIKNCNINATDKNYGIYTDHSVTKLVIENCFIHDADNTGLYLEECWDAQINKVSITANAVMGAYLKKFNSSVFNGTCYFNGTGLKIENSFSSNVRATIQENELTGIDIEGVVASKFHLYLEQNGYNGTDDLTQSQAYIGSYQHVCLSNEFTIYANGGATSEMPSPIGIYALYCENSKFTAYLISHTVTGIHVSSHAIQNIMDVIDTTHVDYGYDKLLQKHVYKTVVNSNTVFDLDASEDCIPVINGDTPYLIAFVRKTSSTALIRVKDVSGTNQSVECYCYILSNGIRTSL